MPFQIIQEKPEEPSFAERLLSGVGAGAEHAAMSIPQMIQNKRNEEDSKEFYKRLTGQDVTGASPREREILLENYFKNQELQAKDKKNNKDFEGLSNTLDWLEDNYKYAGSTKIPFTKSNTLGGLKRTVIGKRAEIDAAGFWATDQIFTHFNKGTVSKEKLKVIREDLAPKSDISERKYKARVSALRRIANLPRNISKRKFDNVIEEEVEKVKKLGKGKKEGKKLSLEEIFG